MHKFSPLWLVYDKVNEKHENVVRISGHFWAMHSLLQKKRGCMLPVSLAMVSYSGKILIKAVGFTEAADALIEWLSGPECAAHHARVDLVKPLETIAVRPCFGRRALIESQIVPVIVCMGKEGWKQPAGLGSQKSSLAQRGVTRVGKSQLLHARIG
ncbi:hypothetical protein [Mesorhizobium australafricanum]|uniref:Transposase n=1 Tax=Mesorhizobium australafricanum TaxID=3072311 RepID=A0ABU4WT18_9HYPH|nr:hypothetical protein [Mesorhizobium sp. VK3E]MDX8439181.1 hypothetical protein [Mesorhizobium sp. VK3E]